MSSRYREPRLEDMLADSIVKAVMEADGVDPRQLEAELRRTLACDTAHSEVVGSAVGVAQRRSDRLTNRAHTTRHDATHRFH
jgi:hypothetical protein